MERTIQAGKLGHYTWIVDDIMIEESNQKTGASSYVKPFEDAENNFGIPATAMQSADVNDLVTLIGNFFGVSFVPVTSMPIDAKGQKGKIKNRYMKRVLQRSNQLYQILNVHTPEVSQPKNF